MASLIAFSNITPTVAEGPVSTRPDAQVAVVQIVQTPAVSKTDKNNLIPELINQKSKEQAVDPNLAQAIAFCESTYQQFNADSGTVLRGIHNPLDVGIFQINEKYHLEKSQTLGFDIYTAEGNIDYALWLMSHEGAGHWKWSKPCWSQKINPAV
ncbi:MAG: hypothetical protein A2571_02675 [Candidatus Vogelbacteria bacterium RIFOXYD1_FULL_44_32]|uniref:Transglycosylase SLT domain-containing protein n=1 Tax=Candidatus Vogelbacteria bacterium RIFOXYD1_FULL_44_32 TaxID=1802438 RepID=A0A1G2QEZ7_9BACT|nr:MAG: hypothetical protein A2571_02675 [Candidatus Vogelbacteria bacterium RIFOXYD1_FULL_44_32]